MSTVKDEVYFFGSCAYEIGAGFPPTWGGSLHVSKGIGMVLTEGMTFHVPMNFTVPGRFGMAISQSVAITALGCKMLAQHPRQLHYV